MSEGPITACIDIRKAFSQELEVAGSVDSTRLPQISEAAASEGIEVQVSLKFVVDRFGQKKIQGFVTAKLKMICQRCLQPAPLELQESIKLALLASEDQISGLDPEWDPWITSEPRLELADLVEEQLMLALPIVHMHEDVKCIEKLGYHAETDRDLPESADNESGNPFSILKQLKMDEANK